jgi:hypothetical protein
MDAESRFEAREPKLLTGSAVLALNAFGLLAYLPVLAAFVIVSTRPLSVYTFLLPLAAAAVTVLFLPIAVGNPYIAVLARRITRASASTGTAWLVQLKVDPRLRSGSRAILDDADDIGWLVIRPEGIEFHGDSVTACVPRLKIRTARRRSIGWHGLFLTGARLEYQVAGIPGVAALEFTERSSRLAMGSRRIASLMFEAEKAAAAAKTSSST